MEPSQAEPHPRLRVAMARLSHETNALSPLRTRLQDFQRSHLVEGTELLQRCAPWRREVPGFLRNGELSGFVRAARSRATLDIVPLFSAWAVPGGKLDPETFGWFRQRLLDGLRGAGPLDGLYLALHGALGVEGVADPEGLLLREIRELLGSKVRIVASFDLHCILTDAKVRAVDAVLGYHTNPHRDFARVGARSARALIRMLRHGARPTTAWRSLPMISGGGPNVDMLPPMRSIFREAGRLERRPRVLAASFFQGQFWHDAPGLGWAASVTTDEDQPAAEALAESLAGRLWAVRRFAIPTTMGPIEAVQRARKAGFRRMFGLVCLSDTSDAVGAGATGEGTALLAALLEHGKGLRSFVPLHDPAAVARLWPLEVGTVVDEPVGGGSTPDRYCAIQVQGKVRRKVESRRHGRGVVLDCGHVQLVLTEIPPMAIKPSFFGQFGLQVTSADVVVVKSLFLFRIFFAVLNRLTLYVHSSGITDLLDTSHVATDVPVFPCCQLTDWHPADQQRRGLAGLAGPAGSGGPQGSAL